MSLIEVKNLTLKTETATLFTGLNFKVNRGDYLVIVGENGSGKTTLMNTILGLRKIIVEKYFLVMGLPYLKMIFLHLVKK